MSYVTALSITVIFETPWTCSGHLGPAQVGGGSSGETRPPTTTAGRCVCVCVCVRMCVCACVPCEHACVHTWRGHKDILGKSSFQLAFLKFCTALIESPTAA